MSLGMNRTRLAILVALAKLGGGAYAAALVESTGIITPTLIIYLKELEAEGYVVGDVPPEERRRGVRVYWTLRAERLHSDLRDVIAATTPVPRDASSTP